MFLNIITFDSSPFCQMQASNPVVKKAKRRARKAKKKVEKVEEGVVKALTKVQVPRNEQLALANLVSRQKNKMVADYMSALIAPQAFMSRVPDSFARPTSLWRSKITLDVPVFVGTPVGANDGRFALAISPTLGALSLPQQYKVAMIDASGGWPSKGIGSNVPKWVSAVNGRDIRLDPFLTQLTQAPLGYETFDSDPAGTTSSNCPFGLNPTIGAGYGLQVAYSSGSTPGTVSRFFPPPGTYVFNVSLSMAGGVPDSTITTTPGNLAQVFFVSSRTSADKLLSEVTGIAYIPQYAEAVGQPYLQFACAGGSVAVGEATFAPTFTDSNLITKQTFNMGALSAYRTVGMSCLATYIGPELTNGGNIAAAYLASDAANTQFFQNNALSGNLRNWENLAIVTGAYNGPIRDGAYVWWSPSDLEDYQMLDPDAANLSTPPTLLVSGQYMPGQAGAGGLVVRIEITTIYEGLTESLLYESEYLAGSQATMDQVTQLLAGQQHAMANAAHSKFINTLLQAGKKILGFGIKNKDVLLPLAKDFAGTFL